MVRRKNAKTGRMSLLFTLCLSLFLIITAWPAEAHAEEGKRISFDGDSTYDWAHFYYIDSKEDTISDLKIQLLDPDSEEINPELYTLTVSRTWWDDDAGEDVYETVTAPYGISGVNLEAGFNEFRVSAVMKDDPEDITEGTFFIIDSHSICWICAEVTFPGFKKKDGWRMCDRFWVDLEKLTAPVVKAGGEKVLTEGTDYEVTYFTRVGDLDDMNTEREKVLAGDKKLSGLPTKPGGYVLHIRGIGDYYGETEILLDVEGEPVKTGWETSGKKRKYYDEEGNLVTGWKKISGKWYYFDKQGWMVTGWKKIGNKWYCFDNSGIMQTGWRKTGNSWYYLMPGTGQMVTGWKQINKKWYYFKTDGTMAANEYCKGYWLNKDGTNTYTAKAVWKKDKTGWYFIDTKGWYAKSQKLTIDGVIYSFNAAGYCTNP